MLKKRQKEQQQEMKKSRFSIGFNKSLGAAPTGEHSGSFDSLRQELHKQGVDLFTGNDIDSEYLKLPAMLTDVHSRDLGNYFNSFTKQKMYCRTLQGEARALVRDIERDLDDIRLDIYRSLAPKMSIKEKEMHVQEHKTAAELMRQADHYRAKLQVLTDYISSIEDAIMNVSREITRRENDMEEHRRGGNLR